jgi:hypothetical protein
MGMTRNGTTLLRDCRSRVVKMVAACNQGLLHVRLATVLLANVLVLVRGGDAVRCGVRWSVTGLVCGSVRI